MENNLNMYLNPAEISENLISMGIKKAKHPMGKLILLGVLAGAYIGFASHLATTVSTGWRIGGEDVFLGMKKFMSGSVFAIGLMLVLIVGAELFTGNCLMPVALYEKKISLRDMLRNWGVVWLANFAGSLILVWMIAGLSGLLDGEVGETAVKIAAAKSGITSLQMFIRGILANWIVCIAVLMCIAARDIAGKLLGIFFPIMGFVMAGFEHGIANMYIIPAGLIVKSAHMDPAAYPALNLMNCFKSILIVTAGNIVGGAVLVATVYYYLYVRKGSESHTPMGFTFSRALD